MMLYIRLFFEFFKAGLFAIGGGMATIPFLYDISDATNWFTHNDLANMIAVSESTPGPIGVNMATYVGFITGMNNGSVLFGVLGAITATIGLVAPSIVIIILVAKILNSFKENHYVKDAFYGLRPASTGLIAAAGLTVLVSNLFPKAAELGYKLSAINWKGIILGILLWVFTNKVKQTKKLHPVVFIAASAVIGIVFSM